VPSRPLSPDKNGQDDPSHKHPLAVSKRTQKNPFCGLAAEWSFGSSRLGFPLIRLRHLQASLSKAGVFIQVAMDGLIGIMRGLIGI
jgi:hypothetical protein